MKKYISLAVTGLFLLGLPLPGWAQKEVQPPAVPPILEGQRPLERPETTEPSPAKKAEGEKIKSTARCRRGPKSGRKSKLAQAKQGKRSAAGKKKTKKRNFKKGAGNKAQKNTLADRT